MKRMTEKSTIGGCFPYYQVGIINGKNIEEFNNDCLLEGFKNYDQFYGYQTAITMLGRLEDIIEYIESLENPFNPQRDNEAFTGFETAKCNILLKCSKLRRV